MARRSNRFTVFDMMEAKGVFEANPANVDARDQNGASLYSGPVPYPKMFYSPTGERKITVPAEIITTPMGPKMVGEQSELIYEIVNDSAGEARLRAAGWHDHPAKAIAAAGGIAPAMSSDSRILELEAQIAKLQAESNNEKAKVLAESGPSRTIKGKPALDPFAPDPP